MKRKIKKIIYLTIILFGFFLTYIFNYTLIPLRNLNNYDWITHTTPTVQFEETVKRIKRTGWEHQDGSLGLCGDKAFAKFIIENLQEINIESCIQSNKINALQDITNQGIENVTAWKKWWEENKDLSQLVWIYNGFKSYGINIKKNNEFTKENIVHLLKIIGSNQPSDKYNSGHYLSINAKRLLYMRSFDAVDYLRSNYNESVKDIEILIGLLDYNRTFWDILNTFPHLTLDEEKSISDYRKTHEHWYFSSDAYVISLFLPILISCLGTYLLIKN